MKNGWKDSDHPNGKPAIKCISKGQKSGEIRKYDLDGNLIETYTTVDLGRISRTTIMAQNPKPISLMSIFLLIIL